MSKKTLLNSWHRSEGANMAAFGGYDMPLWYPSGAKQEHLSVINNAGIFDTSHMALLTVKGAHSRDLLQFCFTKDLDHCIGKKKTPLVEGRCAYGAFLNEKGEVLDDAIVYFIENETYALVVNANMGSIISAHLKRCSKSYPEVDIQDLTDKIGKIDVQGPNAALFLAPHLSDPESIFTHMPYFSFKGTFDSNSHRTGEVRFRDNTPILVSRTGYTGEFGFELFMDSDHLIHVWHTLVNEGRKKGLLCCGLAARDSLRTGAVLPLSHQDIGPWPFINHPWHHALPFDESQTGFTKSFMGDEALQQSRNSVYVYAFVGFDLRKISSDRSSHVFDSAGNDIGTVSTCVTDMAIDRHEEKIYSIASPDKPEGFRAKGLSCGFVRLTKPQEYGTILELKDGKRSIKVMITEDVRPYRTARKSVKEMLTL
ncbi:MAG: aminomethyltransferase family protein [Syntrophales bacterium]|jgi:aminomethyltransferase|nr:aminomethyltransferase family protein [Syntrophales bacterium]MDY0045468.1 aminomethyltransferase family protein [Syntrophales bacterium]